MIVIGADTDKRTHALAAVDAGTGRVRGAREIKAEQPGHLAALRWARGLDEERVWALEDCRHVSRRLEQALIAAGERVVRVPPQRMGASRRGEREPGKSDQIDALAIARAVVKDGVERFHAAHLDEQAMEIRLLCDHRKHLVAERTRVQNRLRWHLFELSPELERSLGRGSLEKPRQLDRVDRRLRRMPACARVRVAREQVARLRALSRQVDALEQELLVLVKAHRPQLLAETGCGALTAAVLIGRTAGAERFPSDASFARLTGTAPIPAHRGSATGIGSTAAATANSTAPCTSSPSPAPATTRSPRPTWPARKPRARPGRERSAASSATSRGASTTCSPCQPRAHSTTPMALPRSPPNRNSRRPRSPALPPLRCPA